MNKETAQFIVDNSENASLYEGYSGRGMYGTKTNAVKTDDAIQALTDVTQAMTGMDSEDYPEDLDFYGLTIDSLGLGQILY